MSTHLNENMVINGSTSIAESCTGGLVAACKHGESSDTVKRAPVVDTKVGSIMLLRPVGPLSNG